MKIKRIGVYNYIVFNPKDEAHKALIFNTADQISEYFKCKKSLVNSFVRNRKDNRPNTYKKTKNIFKDYIIEKIRIKINK